MTEKAGLSAAAIDALKEWPLFDNAIVHHGFVSYMRDYEVIVETAAATPDRRRSYLEGRYRFLFTHCVRADVETRIRDETWQASWSDEFINYSDWETAGTPAGFVWGVQYMDAYPGATIVAESETAAEWTSRLGKPMSEVTIETNAQLIRIVFHGLDVYKVAEGDPATNELNEIPPRDILAAT